MRLSGERHGCLCVLNAGGCELEKHVVFGGFVWGEGFDTCVLQTEQEVSGYPSSSIFRPRG